MKVAVCLRGAVSKKIGQFVRNYLYVNSPYVDYKICRNSIFKHIVYPNKNYEFDFFIHCWNEDLKEDMIKLYDPKDYIFENNDKYNKEIKKFVRGERDYAGISHSLTMKKSIEIMEEYSKKTYTKYDFVIIYRPDLILFKNMILKNYNVKNYIYTNAWNHANGDFHFVMNFENAVEFKSIYDSLYKGNKHKQHCWIKRYVVTNMKKRIIMDQIVPPKDQEVLRKLKSPKNKKLYRKTLKYKKIYI